MHRDELLDKAKETVTGPREKTYGSPEKSLAVIGKLWSVVLGTELRPGDIALMMALLKIARLIRDNYHEDSWVDLAGYAAIGSESSQKFLKAVLNDYDAH